MAESKESFEEADKIIRDSTGLDEHDPIPGYWMNGKFRYEILAGLWFFAGSITTMILDVVTHSMEEADEGHHLAHHTGDVCPTSGKRRSQCAGFVIEGGNNKYGAVEDPENPDAYDEKHTTTKPRLSGMSAKSEAPEPDAKLQRMTLVTFLAIALHNIPEGIELI